MNRPLFHGLSCNFGWGLNMYCFNQPKSETKWRIRECCVAWKYTSMLPSCYVLHNDINQRLWLYVAFIIIVAACCCFRSPLLSSAVWMFHLEALSLLNFGDAVLQIGHRLKIMHDQCYLSMPVFINGNRVSIQWFIHAAGRIESCREAEELSSSQESWFFAVVWSVVLYHQNCQSMNQCVLSLRYCDSCMDP